MTFITDLLNQYGYVVLFFALALELIAFPTPGETLMTYCGFLSFQGQLNWGLSILTASLGIITGITVSHFIGYYWGAPFFERHGARIHMGPERMERMDKWFGKYGNGLLIVAYFIPGIRHVTGYFSGITKIPFKRFAVNAYIGAFVWSGTFISLGKILGANWEKYNAPIKKYFIILGIISGLILLSIYLFKGFKEQIISFLNRTIVNSVAVFHTSGKIKLVLIGFSTALVALAFFVGGLIQDFMANEFVMFNEIVNLALPLIFTAKSSDMMVFLSSLSSYWVMVPVCIFMLIWILFKGENKMLEIRLFIILTIGSEFLEESLRWLFHLLNPASSIGFSFPSEQSFLAVIIYGYTAYVFFRHIKARWIGVLAIFISLAICFSTGIGLIYLGIQKPSDIVAGYAFGSFILCIIIILVEIYRILLLIKNKNN